jgi:CRISPR-associated protein Csx17
MSTRIGELLPGLALARIPGRLPEDGAATLPVPLAYAVLKPLFCPYAQLRKIGYLRPDATLPLPPELIRQLAAGRVDQAVEGARRRLRASGVPTPVPQLRPIHRDGPRLLAALMVPISDRGLKKVLRALPVDKPREDPNLNEDMTHAD